MKYITPFLTVVLTVFSNSDINAQNQETLDSLALDSITEYEIFMSPYTRKGALKDISKGEINLLLPGGIVGAPYHLSDTIFEKKYDVTFIRQGCVRYPGENQNEYNGEMFKYLDETYGRGWRKEIRDDVIGLKKR
jgi:hypothetical protein